MFLIKTYQFHEIKAKLNIAISIGPGGYNKESNQTEQETELIPVDPSPGLQQKQPQNRHK